MRSHGKLSEHVKVDVALPPTSLATTAGTGAYHRLDEYRKALFVAEVAAMAAGNTVALQVMEAKDGAGDGADVLTGAAATVTANAKVAAATITGATVADGNTFTINGVTFTVKDSDPDIDAGEFASGADDTAAMANAAAAVNHLLPELRATSAAAVLTVQAREPGEATVTLSGLTATRFVGATLRAAAFVEVDASMVTEGFTHVALRATTVGTVIVGATLVRSGARHGVRQQVAASKTDLST